MNPHQQGKSALLCVANGSEDLETVTIIDILRRADIPLTLAKVYSKEEKHIASDMNINLMCKLMMGTLIDVFAESKELHTMLSKQIEQDRHIAAICASPAKVLVPFGILTDQKATCYPTMNNIIKNKSCILDKVVVDGNLITSQGPGTAALFALKIVQILKDKKTAQNVAQGALIDLQV
ncbi:UNKNOWN [Stylonychia lemnae]|uniref:DJ-1/PfpI domain-containing protein n=1 Tax=Stylonychia lemnae TaxID=5949 RepID=A0A077ZPW9_STYLE|nr:UNKNOWN [Stylonychia lemnae]|eukprot:CDW71504.1 UNKNOWN [Stylonychia lemnae]